MKKILSLLAILASSTSTSLTVVACGSSSNNNSYNSIESAIKSLKLNSFSPTSATIENVNEGITNDIFNALYKLKFSDSVYFIANSFNIKQIINNSTNQDLRDEDLINVKTLDLKIIITYNNADIQVSSCTLNITNAKSDQEIINYINNFNFNDIFNTISAPFLKMPKADFEYKFKDILYKLMGSYAGYINISKWFINSYVTKGNVITQDNLNTPGVLALDITYAYNLSSNQTIKINVNLSKWNLSNFFATEMLNFQNITVTLSTSTNNKLTDEDVILIIDKINDEILNIIQEENSVISADDFSVVGIEDTVKKDADFSNPKIVQFIIAAKSTSEVLEQTSKNQIKVIVNNT